MSKSMLLVPVQEDELSQPLYVEGVHNPDELARASGGGLRHAAYRCI